LDNLARCQWLTPVILATWETVIWKTKAGEVVCETPSAK
jgi:hypothetical protein